MAEEEYKRLVRKRSYEKAALTRLFNFFHATPNATLDDVENRKIKLDEIYSNFNEIQFEIENILTMAPQNASLITAQESEKAAFEDTYYNCANFISNKLRSINPSLSESNNAASSSRAMLNNKKIVIQQSQSILPKVEIKAFDGNPLEWYSFHDTFLSLVHNEESLPTVQKFHILKNSLRGNLTTVMDSLSASDENYQAAWDTLIERCNRPRQIIYSHIKAIIDLPEITKDLPNNIRNLKEKALTHYKALNALGEPVESWSSILIYIIIQKLDKNTRRTWERKLDVKDKPTFNQLIEFLNTQERGDEIETLNYIYKEQNKNSNNYNNDRPKLYINPRNERKHAYVSTQKSIECLFCKSHHYLNNCEQFLKLSPRERCSAAKEKRLCVNCLKSNHSTIKCLASGCKKCHKKHNTLLHFTNQNDQAIAETKESLSENISNDKPKNMLAIINDNEVLMGTARVYILDKNNQRHECRVLLDCCSQAHFITEKMAEKLNLNRISINAPFAGLGKSTIRAKYTVRAKILSKVTGYESELEFVALPNITNILPSKYINKELFSLPKNIKLADPEFNKPSEIDILVGTTVFYKLICNKQIQLTNNADIILQKTLLGWVVTGETTQLANQRKNKGNCLLIQTLDDQLAKFWELDKVPDKKYLSRDEQLSEYIYSTTTKRDKSDDYELLGHMKDVTNIDDKRGYYIPHHAVINNNHLTTKLRVVFDASAKATNNTSLNDCLLVGPTIQNELIFIIMRFRLHNIVLTADIQKMYRQIKVHEEDSVFQKILWRDNEQNKMKVFQLTTVTQGTASAPFLAARTLMQLANDEGNAFPMAAKKLKTDFYVDDLLTGVNTIQEAKQLKAELTELLKRGGFNLHKWASNRKEIFNDIIITDGLKNIMQESNENTVLGIRWNSLNDTISYSISSLPLEKYYTKRIILSQTAKLFDPLGILGPIIIIAKLLVQELWKLKLGWDESLPQSLESNWLNLKNNLYVLDEFKFKRQITLVNTVKYQLHGFCDASEKAYGACIYLRSINNLKECTVKLICSKSRVAPLKTVTLPRLELCAALLLSKLIKTVSEALKLTFDKICLWSDSTVALHWIKMSPHNLKSFVANRVAEIHELTKCENWHHISTSENPADYITRGQIPVEFIKNTHWMTGPEWLTQPESQWKFLQLSTINIPDQRVKISLTATHINCNVNNDIFERFSSITPLIRFVALCLRFIKNKKQIERKSGQFSPQELNEAHTRIIKIIQQQHFYNEINALKQNKPLKSKAIITGLNPFLDDNDIIRVGGRLLNTRMEFSKKFLILLPGRNHVTNLIIENAHIKTWHAGVQGTLNFIRNNYWLIDGKNKTRQIVYKCIRCAKLKPKTLNYMMGNLPIERVTQSRPFENVGIDYCGPFMLKEKKFRNKSKIKSYVSVFVCFATKAIHLELVTDLTSETCLEAIKRFIARRGKPSNIFTDNATNFIGAKNEILKIRAFLLSEQKQGSMSKYIENEGIAWHFTPPRSPHFGGLWEAAVRSFKNHLYRTVGDASFTYEQFNTFIIQIESILNSRPITPLSCDPNDLTALTPAHFLIGDDSRTLANYNLEEIVVNKLSMWQRIQQIKQHFWKRWHKEYINELRTRSKWHQGNNDEIKVGALVLIKEDNLPPMHWSMGRIIQLHPGTDDIVRVVSLKTKNGIYKRCIKKLAPLPVNI